MDNYFDVLVQFIVSRMMVDTTEPDPNNLRNCWDSDRLFLQWADFFVVVQGRNPRSFAQIGRQVLEQVKARHLSPEFIMLAQLAIFRGERLLPCTNDNGQEQKVLDIIDQLRNRSVPALPMGTRRERCIELFNYGAGVFYDARGLFDRAAELQAEAAKNARANNNPVGAAICDFMAVFYGTKYSLTIDSILPSFQKLINAYSELTKALHGSSLEVQWAQGNAPIHVAQVCLWKKIKHPDWSKWIETSLAALKQMGKEESPDADFLHAIKNKEELPLLAIIENRDSSNERKATCQLILMRAALEDGEIEKAARIVAEMPKEGAQHVLAVAQEEIRNS